MSAGIILAHPIDKIRRKGKFAEDKTAPTHMPPIALRPRNETEEILDRICEETAKSKMEIWNLYVNRRLELQEAKMALVEAISTSVVEIGTQLGISQPESRDLYTYLYVKFN